LYITLDGIPDTVVDSANMGGHGRVQPMVEKWGVRPYCTEVPAALLAPVAAFARVKAGAGRYPPCSWRLGELLPGAEINLQSRKKEIGDGK
jgi:hypothetical protein